LVTLSKLERAKALANITNILFSDHPTALINIVNFKKRKMEGRQAMTTTSPSRRRRM
jgi:hypothetical protein